MKTTQLVSLSLLALASSALGACGVASEDNKAGDLVLENNDTSSDAVRVCAAGPTVTGVDVSFYQGSVDWQRVKNAGRTFGIARISDGTRFIDDQFRSNWNGIKAVGLVRGSYQFFRPAQSATAQADIVVNALGKLGDGDLPAVIDVESADGQSSATIAAGIRTWIQRVEAGTGKKPIIYAASGFWNTLSGVSEFAQYPLWVANYGVSCPSMPYTWSNWKFWQYTDSGSTPGIPGGVDTNYFNGSLTDLLAFARGGTGTPPAPTSIPIEVYWSRQGNGSYDLRALADAKVASVEYAVDGYEIGSADRNDGSNFPTSYTFTSSSNERKFVVTGFDAGGKPIGRGVGLIDVTPGVGVYIRQQGAAIYEIGLERAPAEVAAIEVKADGYVLTDAVSGTIRSTRRAVRSKFNTLGARSFEINTYNANGTLRGTLRRSFKLE